MFCTFVSLEWKTILLQSTLPTRWPSLDTRSMHPNQWHWGQWGDGQDVSEMVQTHPTPGLLSFDLLRPWYRPHTTNKANAGIYCLNLPGCNEVHWGSEIPTSESKQRTLHLPPALICSILSSVGRVLATDSHFIASCSCLVPSSWGWPSRDRVINIHYNRSHSSIQQLL